MNPQIEERYRLDTGRLVARRGPYGALLFIAGVGLAGVLEYRYHPERLLDLLLFFALELAICAAASMCSRRQRFRRARVALTFAASVALIVCVTAYGLLAGTNVALMAFLFVVFELTAALVLPWGARNQAIMAGICILLYTSLLYAASVPNATLSEATLPVAYALYAVAAGGVVSVLGALFLDRQRFAQFAQREQLDQHLLTFRELTRAFRGFDPQLVIFLACRAALHTFGLRRLWVAWQAVGGGGVHGYVVRYQQRALDWQALADAQPFWGWMSGWETDAGAFLIRGSDHRLPVTMQRASAKSLVCIPLQFEGERLGAICGDCNGDAFELGDRELALASVLANAASIALVNAQLYHQAAAASEEKSDFLARIAHELRNPLQALLWDLDIIRAEPAPHPELDRVQQNALMTLDLAKELQDFAEVETRRLVASPEPVNLAQTLDNLEATAMGLIEGRPIEYRTKVAPGAEVVVTDPIRLRQIVGNLISNAVKFTTRGTIEVEARPIEAEIAISVRDTGVGIPEAELASIFSPFYRGTARSLVGTRGMGLGLAIAHDLAKLLGGRIEVESTAGAGSIFRLVLPRPPAESAETRELPLEMLGAAVLLIEDDERWRQELAAALRRAGAQVIEAVGGIAGLRRARELEPDAIVLDVGLPEMGGTDVLERLKGDPAVARVPVLIITAEHDAATEARCRAIGCAAYVVKPCSAEELIRLLAPFVRRLEPTRTAIEAELTY